MKKVILVNGNTVDLPAYQATHHFSGDQLAIHFEAHEFECGGELLIAEPLLYLLDDFREELGHPVKINSGYRTEAFQVQLRTRNRGAASISPHCHGMAADIDTVSNEQTDEYVALLHKIAKEKGLQIRVGYKQYKGLHETFVHVDVCPEYFAPGKPYHSQPHPWQWEQSIEW